MNQAPLALLAIPANEYSNYRYDVIAKAYKWDPQVNDTNTVSPHAVIITSETADELRSAAEDLSKELCSMEEALLARPALYKALGFYGKIKDALATINNHNSNNYNPKNNVRLMRFDFHPTDKGWEISEVNSDVPGGLAEASILPEIAKQFFPGSTPAENILTHILHSFKTKLAANSRIAFVHATSYSDDRQVMQCLGDYFFQHGYKVLFAAPDHISWENGKAYSIIEGAEGAVDGIVRFFPLEWFATLPRKSGWKGYFTCGIPCCNHAAAMLTQSKRLPLVWDALGVPIPSWKKFLPETLEPRSIAKGQDGWIYKPAFGRVGMGISVKGAVPEKECKKIEKAARSQKRSWVAQKMFTSKPIPSPSGDLFHVCLGVFAVDNKAAGFYARLSSTALIGENAVEVPVLICS
jgi:glutathionylspermidine synthase